MAHSAVSNKSQTGLDPRILAPHSNGDGKHSHTNGTGAKNYSPGHDKHHHPGLDHGGGGSGSHVHSTLYAAGDANPIMNRLKHRRFFRYIVTLICLVFIITPIALLFLPWQQSLQGRGRVIAYDPTERQQVVTSRIDGNISKWHVIEGSRVKEGDPIVDIEDNDPNREERLNNQRNQLMGQLQAIRENLKQQQMVIDGQTKARDAAVDAAKKAREAADHQLTATEQALEAQKTILQRDEELLKRVEKAYREGVETEVSYLRALAARDQALADYALRKANVEAASANLAQAAANVIRIEADATNQITLAQRTLNDIQGSLLATMRAKEDIDTQIERFSTRFIKAPISGTVLRVESNAAQGGAYVKQGEVLAIIVPDTSKYIVELMIPGVDAPLIQRDADGKYPHVRLQFEGWPAVQFVGWPSAARGTFGGRVVLIDQHDNGKGEFRVLIEEDNDFSLDDGWPSRDYLRQGNQAIGWVFLNRVTLGWELWRRLNGFPPVLGKEEPGKKKEKGDKPPKIKVSG